MKIYVSKNLYCLVLLLATLLPSLAHAHAMNVNIANWASGFIHPLQGVDHLIAMLAVGFWAMRSGKTAIWLLPLTFVSVMTMGGVLGTQGLMLPSAEWLIVSSGLVLAVLAIQKQRFSSLINALIVAFFAFFHGYAHGYELTDTMNFLPYSLGFITATLLLHGAGIVLAGFVELVVNHKRLTDVRSMSGEL